MIQQIGHIVLCLAAIASATVLCAMSHLTPQATTGVVLAALGTGVTGTALNVLKGSPNG